MNRNIVLDKSYLRASNVRAINDLSSTSRLLLPDSLLYEISKDNPSEFAHHLNKLCELTNTTFALPYFGKSLRFEAENHRQSPMASATAKPLSCEDHKTLRDNLTKGFHAETIKNKASEYQVDKDAFVLIHSMMSQEMQSSIPQSGSDDIRLKKLNEFEERIANDFSFIHDYALRLGESFSSINENWASYVYLQVQSLFTAEKWS